MKKTIQTIALILAAFAWGCASEPTVDETAKPGVEDRTPGVRPPSAPSAAPLAPPGARPLDKPAAPPRPALSPLKDPANILSKRSVFYDYDSDVIKEEFRPLIQAHAKYLAANPSTRMLIQGNCDERGSREYNIALGQRRAESLKRMLTLLGARDSQIESVSLGEEKPRCTDQTEACWAQNRRSDMLYSGEF